METQTRLLVPQLQPFSRRAEPIPWFWGLVMLAIALRGGGPYSLDRVIRREL